MTQQKHTPGRSVLVLGDFLAPLQFALDRLTDELGASVLANKRIYTIRHVIRQSNQYWLHVQRWASHSSVGIRYRNVSQFWLRRMIKRYRLLTVYPISVITSITNRLETANMAKIKYFNGENELSGVYHDNGKFFGYVSKEDLVFVTGKGWTGYVQADRVIEYKSNPSRHECDARCMNATGRVMKCECSCGGKNHGRGSFVCAEAA